MIPLTFIIPVFYLGREVMIKFIQMTILYIYMWPYVYIINIIWEIDSIYHYFNDFPLVPIRSHVPPRIHGPACAAHERLHRNHPRLRTPRDRSLPATKSSPEFWELKMRQIDGEVPQEKWGGFHQQFDFHEAKWRFNHQNEGFNPSRITVCWLSGDATMSK